MSRWWSCLGIAAFLAVFCMPAGWADTKQITLTFDSREDFETATRDLTIDTASVPGQVRLLPTVLIQDEIGDTFALQESPSDTVHLKKELVLDSRAALRAEVLVFVNAAQITVNGHPVPGIVPASNAGWQKAEFPPSWLKKGLNEMVISGGGNILIEPRQTLGRSARSVDGGKTWQYIHGEYMVKLRLWQFPRSGTITSDVIDLGTLASNGPIGVQTHLKDLQIEVKGEVPRKTAVTLQVRGGSTPFAPQEGVQGWQEMRDLRVPVFLPVREHAWTAWSEPENYLAAPDSAAESNRYLQWRAFLSTESPLHAPSIDTITLKATLEFDPLPAGLEVRELDNQKIVRSSLPFAYQEPSERLEFLRENWNLDEVVAPGKTELERFVLLRDWVKHQWKGWEGECTRPWDAIDILSAPENDRGMCVHFAVVFTQCANALGYVSRHCIISHHFVAEVWSNQFRKWIVMDAGPGAGVAGHRNMHYERDGIPQSMLECHLARIKGETEQIMKVASNPDDSGPCDGWGGVFEWFAIAPRNNYLDVPEPAEDGHGAHHHYHYDGYYCWEDNPADPNSPEYSLLVSRAADLYWTLNQVEFHLEEGEKAGEILVRMDTLTPNLKAYMVSIDDGEWQEMPEAFTWSLHPGQNRLQAKTVNAFDVDGIVSSVTVKYGE